VSWGNRESLLAAQMGSEQRKIRTEEGWISCRRFLEVSLASGCVTITTEEEKRPGKNKREDHDPIRSTVQKFERVRGVSDDETWPRSFSRRTR